MNSYVWGVLLFLVVMFWSQDIRQRFIDAMSIKKIKFVYFIPVFIELFLLTLVPLIVGIIDLESYRDTFSSRVLEAMSIGFWEETLSSFLLILFLMNNLAYDNNRSRFLKTTQYLSAGVFTMAHLGTLIGQGRILPRSYGGSKWVVLSLILIFIGALFWKRVYLKTGSLLSVILIHTLTDVNRLGSSSYWGQNIWIYLTVVFLISIVSYMILSRDRYDGYELARDMDDEPDLSSD